MSPIELEIELAHLGCIKIVYIMPTAVIFRVDALDNWHADTVHCENVCQTVKIFRRTVVCLIKKIVFTFNETQTSS